MNRRGMLLMVLAAACVAVPCLAREPMTLERLKEQASADAGTPEGKAYLKQFFTNPWMLALDAAFDRCPPVQERSGAHDEFVIALSIGDNGYPIDALVSPQDQELRCVADQLRTTAFIRPPHGGFAIYMPFKATEPGTEGRSPASTTETTSNQ